MGSDMLTLLKMAITSSREHKALYDFSTSAPIVDPTGLGSDRDMLKNRSRIWNNPPSLQPYVVIKLTTNVSNSILQKVVQF